MHINTPDVYVTDLVKTSFEEERKKKRERDRDRARDNTRVMITLSFYGWKELTVQVGGKMELAVIWGHITEKICKSFVVHL